MNYWKKSIERANHSNRSRKGEIVVKRTGYKILILLGAASLAGCMGYRVGRLLPEHLQTIAVDNFRNLTHEPNIETQATSSVIERFKIDGTLAVVKDNPDAVLDGKITPYDKAPLRFDQERRTTEYRLTVTVQATLKDMKKNEVIWADKSIAGTAEFFVRGSLPTAERAAWPEALDDLAQRIVEQVVEGWE